MWAFAPDSRQADRSAIGTRGETSSGAVLASQMGALGLPGQGELNWKQFLTFRGWYLALVTIRHFCVGFFMDSC